MSRSCVIQFSRGVQTHSQCTDARVPRVQQRQKAEARRGPSQRLLFARHAASQQEGRNDRERAAQHERTQQRGRDGRLRRAALGVQAVVDLRAECVCVCGLCLCVQCSVCSVCVASVVCVAVNDQCELSVCKQAGGSSRKEREQGRKLRAHLLAAPHLPKCKCTHPSNVQHSKYDKDTHLLAQLVKGGAHLLHSKRLSVYCCITTHTQTQSLTSSHSR